MCRWMKAVQKWQKIKQSNYESPACFVATNNKRPDYRKQFNSSVCHCQTGWHKQTETESQTAEDLKNKRQLESPLLFAITFSPSVAICAFLKSTLLYRVSSLTSLAFHLKKRKEKKPQVPGQTNVTVHPSSRDSACGIDSQIFILSWQKVNCNPSRISHQGPLDVT